MGSNDLRTVVSDLEGGWMHVMGETASASREEHKGDVDVDDPKPA